MTPAHKKAISLGRKQAAFKRKMWANRTCKVCKPSKRFFTTQALVEHQVAVHQHKVVNAGEAVIRESKDTSDKNQEAIAMIYSKDQHIKDLEAQLKSHQRVIDDFKNRGRVLALEIINEVSRRFL